MMIFENFRNSDGEFDLDVHGCAVGCDFCKGISEQYIVIENKTLCGACLERSIKMLNKNFMKHCKDSWDRRVKEEENDRI